MKTPTCKAQDILAVDSNPTYVSCNDETGDARLIVWRTADGTHAIETNGNTVWEDTQGWRDTIEAQADKIVTAGGSAGGIDEIKALAAKGWPDNIGLDIDTKDARAAIKAAAQDALERAEA